MARKQEHYLERFCIVFLSKLNGLMSLVICSLQRAAQNSSYRDRQGVGGPTVQEDKYLRVCSFK